MLYSFFLNTFVLLFFRHSIAFIIAQTKMAVTFQEKVEKSHRTCYIEHQKCIKIDIYLLRYLCSTQKLSFSVYHMNFNDF